MTTPPGAVRDTGAVRDGHKRRFPLWLLLLLLLLLAAIIAGVLIAVLSGGSSKKSASVVPAAVPVTGAAAPTTSPTDAAVPPPAAPTTSPVAASTVAAPDSASPVVTSTPPSAAAAAPTFAIKGGFVGGGTVKPVPATGSFAAGDTLGTVLFAENSAELTASAKTVIADAAKTIKADALPKIVVSGYTDEIAGQPSNLTLSGKRAAAVLAALKADVGVGMTTFSSKDHGEQDPIASNSTADGRQQNRRATITTD